MFVVQVGDGLSLHNMGVSGNVDPCEHPDNFFDEKVVQMSEPVSPLFDLGAIFENVLWIRVLPLAVPRCLVLSVVSQVA